VILNRGHSNDSDLRSLDIQQAMRDISAILRRNTHLKGLVVYILDQVDSFELCNDYFDELLCDVSSIENIYNSNHTLEYISIDGELSAFTEECLLLNMDENKAEVIRNKILQYYFVAKFDVSPFSNMALSILPEVMNQIEEDDDKLSAIYRLLQCIPELCNVSARASREQHDSKRPKMI
jgi:hypothetical protein